MRSEIQMKISAFRRSNGGNVAMMFAVMLPVLLTSIGAALDYGRAAKLNSALQAATDATALMISKEAAGIPDSSALKTKALSYFNALYDYSSVSAADFKIDYAPNSGNGASVKIDVSTTMATDFMKIANITQVPLSASSTTRWGNMRYRVALALDNTGSMDDKGKMEELKKATKQLIGDFQTIAKGKDDVYISIVPFSRDVNVGKDFKDASWIRWDEWEETNGNCKHAGSNKNRTACVAAGKTWEPDDHKKWDGCVMDRDQPYDVSGANPSSSLFASMAPAEDYKDCPEPVLKMTSVYSNKNDLTDRVEDMKPKGNTNQSIGLAWAWLTHATNGPFTAPAKDSGFVYMDVIVLLTDGQNTQNRWTNKTSDIDARQSLLCENAKTAGMKIFAIQVATNGDAISSMLKNCTSEPANPNYFSYITDASQMSVKFQNIFKELSRLRVAS